MALARDFYNALVDLLGPENVSEDPVVTESYSFPIRKKTMRDTTGYQPRFEAVTLPGNTKEVQAIVKLCNKHNVQYKASSTGWLYCDPTRPNSIKLDLRRMNHILEINEKSMYAAVEPYVIGAQLQAELMKRGLTCNQCGAGANCSIMPLASHVGLGHMSQSGSYSERNLLAVEWVTGDGEIVSLGTLGSLNEWFSGDGPGPSLRGIIRGNTTPLGGLGVFTAGAVKIYHWPGPASFKVDGVCPQYTHPEMPPNFMIRYLSFKDIDTTIEAVRLVGEAEIGYTLMGFNAAMMASNIATDNQEDLDYLNKFSSQIQGPGFLLIIVANSARDFAYKKGTLEQIMAETDAMSLKDVEDPVMGAGFAWRFIRITGSIRETSRATGWGGGTVGGTDVFPLMTKYILHTSDLKQKLIDKGLIMNDYIYPFIQSIEHGHTGHGEILIRYNPAGPDHIAQVQGMLSREANKTAIQGRFGVPHHTYNDALHDMYGPETCNYHLLMRRVKKNFDPNGLSEDSLYITAKDIE